MGAGTPRLSSVGGALTTFYLVRLRIRAGLTGQNGLHGPPNTLTTVPHLCTDKVPTSVVVSFCVNTPRTPAPAPTCSSTAWGGDADESTPSRPW